MSRLEELIKELCPNGVEYKKVGEVCDTITDYTAAGSFADVAKNVKYINDRIGYAQLIRTTDLKSKFINPEKFVYVDEHAFKYLWRVNLDSEGLVLPNVGNCGEVYYVTPDIFPTEHNVLGPNSIWVKSTVVNNRYLYHVFLAKEFQKMLARIISPTGQTKFNKTNFKELKLPVPPLEVQREIVRVLDSFTLLTAELTAELTARKKQYAFYRNQLLSFDTKVERKKLGDIFDFRNGLSKGKEFFGRGIPFIRYTDVYNHRALRKEDITALVECTPDEMNKLRVNRGDVLFTRTSETAEDIGWSSVMLADLEECVFNGFTIKATPKTNDLLPEYCAYCFSTYSFRDFVTRKCAFTTRASLTGNTIGEYEMAIPSHDVQKRIVEVLDNFEQICNDLSIGLPAEIEARKKQYEYYRDLLLTFAETGNTILTDRQTEHN